MTVQILDNMPELEYHAHPALSSSGAKRIVQTCPAVFKYERDHGRAEKRAFDFGHAAHGLVLGVGEPLVVVDADDWRGKAAREERDAAYAAGKVPILASEHATVKAMADAIVADPLAGALFDRDKGTAERSIFWHDTRHDVERRARLDWLTTIGGRPCAVDYKTTNSADPAAIRKTVANFHYHQQDAWYLDGLAAAGLDDAAFLFVFQEKTPPYLITVVELDYIARRVGRDLNTQALEVFAECTATGVWPGYSSDVELISLPAWATRPALEYQ
jgi:hypothetical protein